jgi:hypothetical protein
VLKRHADLPDEALAATLEKERRRQRFSTDSDNTPALTPRGGAWGVKVTPKGGKTPAKGGAKTKAPKRTNENPPGFGRDMQVFEDLLITVKL